MTDNTVIQPAGRRIKTAADKPTFAAGARIGWSDVLRVLQDDGARERCLSRYRAAGFSPDDFGRLRGALAVSCTRPKRLRFDPLREPLRDPLRDNAPRTFEAALEHLQSVTLDGKVFRRGVPGYQTLDLSVPAERRSGVEPAARGRGGYRAPIIPSHARRHEHRHLIQQQLGCIREKISGALESY